MANEVFLHPEGYIEIKTDGDQTGESVEAMGVETAKLLSKLEAEKKPRFILDNITNLGNTNIPARQKVAELAQTLRFDRAAMLGNGTTLMRIGTNLMLRAIGKSNIRYFEDRDKAVAWLTKRR